MNAIELRAELFREINPLLDSEAAMKKMLAFVRELVSSRNVKSESISSDWASRFSGAWLDNRSTEELINDIRESRTVNTRDIDL